jgi:hypothetical protein
MNRVSTLALLAVLMVPAAMPVASAIESDRAREQRAACLQNNRIWSWRVINERTLIVADIQNRPFLVRLSGGCVGLTNATLRLAFRTHTNLGCLERGDSVSFRAPALGRMSCFVNEVEPYAPHPDEHAAPGDEHRYEG